MKCISILLIVLYFGNIFAQNNEKTPSFNSLYPDIEVLKKAYFEKLRANQDARIFSINEQRTKTVQKKITELKLISKKKLEKTKNYRRDCKLNQLNILNIKKENHNKIVSNDLELRRIKVALDNEHKLLKKKKNILINQQKISKRNQIKESKINYSKQKLQSKFNERKAILINKYTKPLIDDN